MKESKIFDFHKQLKLGNKGENDFLKYYPEATKATTHAYDFDFKGKKLELKTDFWLFKDTENFFIERYSDFDKLKDGSVWQSKHCDYFVYYFINEGIFFWFNIKEFKDFLDEYIKNKSYILVKNKAWTALGYRVKISDCEKFIIRKDKF